MVSLAEVLLIGLAGWRLAFFLVNEAGPWSIALKLREMVGIAHDAEGAIAGWPETTLGKLFACIFCMSFWTCVLSYVVSLWYIPVIYIFAAASVPILLERWLKE